MKRLEQLRRKARMQEEDSSLRAPVEQLHKRQTEFRLMERSLRRRCDKLEQQHQKEAEFVGRLDESTRQKRELLKSGMVRSDVVQRENLTLYQKEMALKLSVNPQPLFITEEMDNSKTSRAVERSSEYANNVLKYPTCDTSRVLRANS